MGRYGGQLKDVRPDDLAAIVLKEVCEQARVKPSEVEDVILGCANQAGEDNRNVARMALLLAGFPVEVPGQTGNRLCGSGMQATISAAREIQSGAADIMVAGGVESMTRSPSVMPKPGAAFARGPQTVYDTALGRATALVLMSATKAKERGLQPLARLVSAAPAGVHPDYMGIGPVPSSLKALEKAGLPPPDMQVVELNEAFASQSLACIRLLGLDEDIVNVNGGAIALGHPLGSSGARLVSTLVREMDHRDAEYGLATMCIGVGQGIASIWQRI